MAELAAPFGMSQPAISKHLKVLERAGLVHQGRDAQRRIEARPLEEATKWLEGYRKLWETNFQRLDALLGEFRSLSEPVPTKLIARITRFREREIAKPTPRRFAARRAP